MGGKKPNTTLHTVDCAYNKLGYNKILHTTKPFVVLIKLFIAGIGKYDRYNEIAYCNNNGYHMVYVLFVQIP